MILTVLKYATEVTHAVAEGAPIVVLQYVDTNFDEALPRKTYKTKFKKEAKARKSKLRYILI